MLWRSLGPAAFVIAASTFLDLAGAHRSQINLEEVRTFQVPPTSSQASPSSYDPYFPEMDIPEIAAKPPKALCISGGGVRAHAAGVGVLRALTDMGLMDKFRYLGAASGGGWLITAYSYFRPNYTFESNDGLWKAPFTTAANDQELLGEIVYPENITWAHLDHVSPQSLRSCGTTMWVLETLNQLLLKGPPFENAFISAIHRVFLEKAGIPPPFTHKRGQFPALFTFSNATREDVYKRNPELKRNGIELIVSRPGRPFMAVGTILLGPMDRVTFDRFKRNYILLETNPLFVGRQNVGNITYISSSKLPWKSTPQTFTVGGALETFAFGASAPDSLSELYLRANDTTGHLRDVKLPEHPFTLSHAAAATGYDFADEISSQLGPISPLLSALLGFKYPYFSPSAQASAPLPSMNDFIADATSKILQEGIGMVENKRQQQLLRTEFEYLKREGDSRDMPFLYGDAGLTENLHLISFLRRPDIDGFVLCTLSSVAFNVTWDPYSRAPTMTDIDDTVTAYFGIDIDKAGSTYDYSRNHVFETSQFNEFVVALQNATRGGKGMVVQMELNVVDNSHWGVQGGRKVNVTWLYLGRAFEWESQLPGDVRAEASVPSKNPQDLPGKKSKFPAFPNFPTAMLRYSPAQANLLSDLAGWIVKENRDKFCRTLGC